MTGLKFDLWKVAGFLLLSTFLTAHSLAKAISEVPQKKKPHVVFLISEDPDNYDAPRTIPVFAESLRQDHGFDVTVLLGEGARSAFSFPGFDVISQADLIVVFCRRVALPTEQLKRLKDYLKQGKPLVGIRTANHAFTVREAVAAGHEAWPEFVADILGCENRGYGPEQSGTEVSIVPEEKKHRILRDVDPAQWHAEGSLYLVAPLLDEKATVLMTGSVNGKVEPITWTRYSADKSRVFYTSLGYPSDFNKTQFRNLLLNGIYWAMGLKRRDS